MAQILFANNAATTLATAISTVTTSLVVTSGGGALFPNPGNNQYFLATLSPATPGAQPQEIVRVTARSTDTFTVTRAQEGTTALSWGTGTIVQNLLTAATVGAFPQTVPFAGNPNGNVSGAAASGNLPPSTVWDYTNNLLYVCTASGPAATAQWSAQAPLTSPQFNGSPTVPNVGFGNNSTLAANTAFVAAGLAPKADTTYVNSQVATRTTYAYVDSQVATRTTPAYVDSQVATRTTYAYVDGQIATRAYVNGNPSNTFDVYPGFYGNHAVNLNQLNNYTPYSAFPSYFSENGYIKIPANYPGFPQLIIQWLRGPLDPADDSEPAYFLSYPISFPNTVFAVYVSTHITNISSISDFWYQTAGFNQSGSNIQRQRSGGGGTYDTQTQAFVLAIGY
jgi:hypothetical protein